MMGVVVRVDVKVKVLLLAAAAAACIASCHAFTAPIISPVRSSLLVRHVNALQDQETAMTATTTSTTTSTITADKESPRLIKAKLLLEQFTDDDKEVLTLKEPTKSKGNTNTNTKSKGTKSKGNTKTKVPIPLDDDNLNLNTVTTTTTVVPDNYWSNGLLDGGDVVTRYAFRRGVKVAEPLVKYDPIKAEKRLFRQPTKWLIRNVQIAVPLGLWAAGVVTDYIFSSSSTSTSSSNNANTDTNTDDTNNNDKHNDNNNHKRRRAVQLRQAISGLGPAIIKAGQALASRPDLLPFEYLEELQKLQDDVPRFSNQIAFATVEQELGVQFNDIFELVQDEPIAAASIGQVYQARLKANGDLVALKIQRPNCEEIISLDLYVLRWWSGIYSGIFRLLKRDINVQSIIDDFGELIYREIDYIAEAANAQRFNELYAGVTDVFVPKVYSDLTTRKVLVMEWVDGVRLTDSVTLARYGVEPKKLVDTLVQCSLRQILENGFFHADPHAGNLLACPDGRLCYLDFGMMSYADKKQRNGFLLAVIHIVNRDWSELVRVYQRLGFIPLDTDVKPIEIALENALPDVLNSEISEVNFKNVVNKLGDIMYTFPFTLPPFYIAIIRCLGVLEGLAIQVDPKSRIISEAYPYVASRVLTDPQEDLQEALRRLALTSDGRVRWNRLEGLLDEAQQSSGYDVTAALDVLTDYLISDEGESLLAELAQVMVDAADNIGTESLGYLVKASQALVVRDEVAAVKAFRSFQKLVQRDGSFEKDIKGALPEITPSMKRFARIIALLDGGENVSKFVPIVRKLAQEPKVQRAASEVMARLGERVLSRSLRAVFGLPPPVFNGKSSAASTVFEQGIN